MLSKLTFRTAVISRGLCSRALPQLTLHGQLSKRNVLPIFGTAGFSSQPTFESADLRVAILRTMEAILRDDKIRLMAKERYIPSEHWDSYLNRYRRSLTKAPLNLISQELFDFLMKNISHLSFVEPPSAQLANHHARIKEQAILTDDDWKLIHKCKDQLVPAIFESAEQDLKEVILSTKTLASATDLRLPQDWYPRTRLMKRKIIFHGGPTNSGKTYQALQALKNTPGKGLYCGPLRLLALEIYEKLNKEGVYCNLLTGQEREEVPFATHVSCTVEMADINEDFDVAVIDEIQMIADSRRGHSWTRAVLGLCAKEIHLCGGLEAAKIVEKLVAKTGDEFILQRYDRLSTLQIADKSLRGDYSKVRPGDCVVAFNREDIFSIRYQIESSTKYKCAVIYGQLPPEVRSAQARLFNEGKEFDVLVATDAIGMGLNLQIGRMIFHTTLKRELVNINNLNDPAQDMEEDGQPRVVTSQQKFSWQRIDPSHIKQIAGRAGRMSSKFSVGEVTAWQEFDLAYVRAVMSFEVPEIQRAGIFPSVEQMEHFSSLMTSFAEQEKEQERLREQEQQASEPNLDDWDMSTDPSAAESRPSIATVSAPAPVSSSLYSNIAQGIQSSRKQSPIAAAFETAGLVSRHQRISTATISKSNSYSTILLKFVEMCKMDGGHFFMCDYADSIVIANWLAPLPVSLEEIYKITNAPCSTRDESLMTTLYSFIAQYAMRRPVALNVRFNKQKPRSFDEFSDICSQHNALELYHWLTHRFPDYFIEQEACIEQKNYSTMTIQQLLFAGNIIQGHTHYGRYCSMMEKFDEILCDRAADVHPNKEAIKDILKKTRNYLENVPKHLHVVLPEGVGARSNRRDSGRHSRRPAISGETEIERAAEKKAMHWLTEPINKPVDPIASSVGDKGSDGSKSEVQVQEMWADKLLDTIAKSFGLSENGIKGDTSSSKPTSGVRGRFSFSRSALSARASGPIWKEGQDGGHRSSNSPKREEAKRGIRSDKSKKEADGTPRTAKYSKKHVRATEPSRVQDKHVQSGDGATAAADPPTVRAIV